MSNSLPRDTLDTLWKRLSLGVAREDELLSSLKERALLEARYAADLMKWASKTSPSLSPESTTPGIDGTLHHVWSSLMKAGLNTSMCHSSLSRELGAMLYSAANAAKSNDAFAADWEKVKQMSFEPEFLKLTTELNDKLVKMDRKKGKPGKDSKKIAELEKAIQSQQVSWSREADRVTEKVNVLEQVRLNWLKERIRAYFIAELNQAQLVTKTLQSIQKDVESFDVQKESKILQSAKTVEVEVGSIKTRKITLMDRFGTFGSQLGGTLSRVGSLRSRKPSDTPQSTNQMKEMPITATPATIPEPSSFSVLPVDADGFTIPPEEQGDWTKAYTQDTQNRPDAPFEDEEESVMGAPANKIKVDIRPESLPTQNDDDLKHAANVLKGGLLNLGNSKRASQIQSDKVLPEGNLTHVVMATGETEGIVKPAVFDTAVDVSTTLVPSSESQHIGVEDFAAIAKTQLVEEKENVAILAKSLESTAEISVSNGVFDPKEHPMEDKSDLPVSQTIFNGPSQIDIFGSREESLEHIETPGKKKPEIRDLDPYGDSQPPSQTESPTRSSRDLLNAFVVPAPSGTLGKPEENQGSQPSIDDTQQAYAIPPPPPTLGRKKKSRENLKSSVTVSAQAPAVATRSRRDLGLSETSLSEWGETILSHLVPEEDVSVKLSVSETINVLFKGGVADKLLLFGAVSLTLAPQRLARRGVCKVVVQNPGNFSVIVPNPEVAQASDPFSPHILDIDVSQFPPSKTSLVVPIFEYQVNCSTESKQAFVPLWVTSTWKKEPTALLLLLAYQGNNRNGSSQILLSDVMFQAFPTLPKGVTLDSVSTKPDGQWDSSNRCVSWAVPPLDPYVTAQTAQDLAMKTPMTATSPGTTNALVKAQDPTMKLLAKLDGTEAEAGYVSVSFQSSDLLSAMELSVEGMELTGTTRSLRSGKYVCLP